MKKKILVVAIAIICMAIVGYGTYAFLSYHGTVRNVITTGGIDISVLEEQVSNGEMVPYPAADVDVMPGTEVSKIVSVRNDEKPAYIRMKYKVVVLDSRGKIMDIDPEKLEKLVTISGGSDNWIKKGDWWYYNTALDIGEVSEPLFDTVTFSARGMGNEYQNSIIKIVIYAHAVQADNNPAPGGDTTAVRGWPNN